MGGAARPDEPDRAQARAARNRAGARAADSALSPPPPDPARPERLGPGELPLWSIIGGFGEQAELRPLLPAQLLLLAGSADPAENDEAGV